MGEHVGDYELAAVPLDYILEVAGTDGDISHCFKGAFIIAVVGSEDLKDMAKGFCEVSRLFWGDQVGSKGKIGGRLRGAECYINPWPETVRGILRSSAISRVEYDCSVVPVLYLSALKACAVKSGCDGGQVVVWSDL